MDDETVRMLEDLPDDLRIRGWTLSASESTVTKKKPLRYRVVYVRPVDDRRDHQQGDAIYDRQTRQQVMRISTYQDRSASWEDARQDAIQRMHLVDARIRRDAG